jgi:hypothetical protein
MIFFTVLFTLESADPKQNQYVYMLPLLAETLHRTGTYRHDVDSFYILADDATAELISQFNMESLAKIQILRIPRPKTLLEGIASRYTFFRQIYEPTMVTMYIDLDMLCCREFRPDLPADTLAALPEGSAADPNYCGEDGWANLDHPGLSAGFWAVRIGPRTLALMERILQLIREHPGEFYTIEQVHFNAAITRESPVVFLKQDIVSFNAGEDDDISGVHFVNLAGEPGNGSVHFIQMLNCFMTMI